MLLAASVMLFCVSCFHPHGAIGYRVTHVAGYSIDARFTDEEAHDIRSAVAAWEKASKGHLVMEEESVRWSLFHFHKWQRGELGLTSKGSVIVGLCHQDTGVIDVVPGALTRAIVIHELGHMWGLEHNEDPESFMREDIGNVVMPDGDVKDVDLKPACKVLGC